VQFLIRRDPAKSRDSSTDHLMSASAMMHLLSVACAIVEEGHYGDTSSQERKRRALVFGTGVSTSSIQI